MYIPTPKVQDIVNSIKGLNVQKNETVIILFGEKEIPDVSQLIKELNRMQIAFLGGIFPGLIYGHDKYDSGAIVQILPTLQQPILIRDISNPLNDIEKILRTVPTPKKDNSAAFIILDGLSSNISSFLSTIFNVLGDSINYFGGGAGTLSFEKKPCIFNSDGFFDDCAIIAPLDIQSGFGVKHGWHRMMGPIVATNTDGNTIKELNWRNAFEVFQEAVEMDSGRKIDEDNFFELAKNYAFGIYCEGDEDIVRDALKVNNEAELICAGEVPENAVLNILKGRRSSLINSAKLALEDALPENITGIEHCLVMDCISRSLFLDENFREELKAIMDGLESKGLQIIPQGALSIGEIASRKSGSLEFFNKTTVVGVFHEP